MAHPSALGSDWLDGKGLLDHHHLLVLKDLAIHGFLGRGLWLHGACWPHIIRVALDTTAASVAQCVLTPVPSQGLLGRLRLSLGTCSQD